MIGPEEEAPQVTVVGSVVTGLARDPRVSNDRAVVALGDAPDPSAQADSNDDVSACSDPSAFWVSVWAWAEKATSEDTIESTSVLIAMALLVDAKLPFGDPFAERSR
jgi:hypothetical protein